MIVRHFELKKFNKKSYNLVLLYGKNEGLQKEVLSENFISNFDGIVNKYDESDFLSPLFSSLDQGISLADEILNKYQKNWSKDIKQIYNEYSY